MRLEVIWEQIFNFIPAFNYYRKNSNFCFNTKIKYVWALSSLKMRLEVIWGHIDKQTIIIETPIIFHGFSENTVR